MVESINKNNDIKLINELSNFQNSDKGFGNGLEADIQMPFSSVAASNMAINILESIRDEEVKSTLIEDIVNYLESVYDEKSDCWEIVPKEVDNYPHAVWWNYDSIGNFTYGNPNPEVIGFLYQYRQYLTKIDINHQITKMVDYILNGFEKEVSMHSLLSVIRFYKRVDSDVKNLIKVKIQSIVNSTVSFTASEWSGYVLEPYKIALIDKTFLINKQEILNDNLERHKQKLLLELPSPSWEWFQYKDVFNKVKSDWVGFLTFDIIQALRLNRKL